MENIVKVEFQPTGKRVEVPLGETVFAAARSGGAALASDCGGRGICGRCRVSIPSGNVSPAEKEERDVLERVGAAPGERLACRCLLRGDALVDIPLDSRRFDQKLQVSGVERLPEGEMVLRRVDIDLAAPTLRDQRSDLARFLEALPGGGDNRDLIVGPELAGAVSEIGRSSNWRLTAFLRHGSPVGAAARGAAPLGLAVDLGSSKIAGRLVDLESGREILSAGLVNPQIPFGEDIISRLDFALNQENGATRLKQLLHDALRELTATLIRDSGASRRDIAEAAVCGNTAMSHFLLGLPVAPLAHAPYIAGFSTPLELPARDIGLEIMPGARAFILPCLGGFVGGDHAAMILACELDRATVPSLGIDIGTNTEVVLAGPGENGFLAAASCASGPAFEGAHLKDGMRAASGAISRVRITDRGIELDTIAGGPPVGLCGSGLLDAVSEMLKIGAIDERGRIRGDHPAIRREAGLNSFIIAPAAESGTGRDIEITQRDVSQIQLAKGAIRAGIEALLKKTGTNPAEVARIYIAGAFGSFLDPESAVNIGLLPRLPRAEFVAAGNAALVGAALALVSREERSRAADIARRARHVELAADPEFSRDFARALRFPPAREGSY
ncbi:MAG: ASKHA domain-containing protein [Pseudomonadota bacterium]